MTKKSASVKKNHFNYNQMNKQRLLLRIIASPFIFGILFISWQYHFVRHFISVMRYGGEWVSYEKDQPATMTSIFRELKKQNLEE